MTDFDLHPHDNQTGDSFDTQESPESEHADTQHALIDHLEASQQALTSRVAALVQAYELVVADIRAQSSDSALVTPERWQTEGMIPEEVDSQEFIDQFFDVLETNRVLDEHHTATPSEQLICETTNQSSDIPLEENAPSHPETPETPAQAIALGLCSIPTSDIVVLEGADTVYFYADSLMTDNYAMWAFLAKEDDRVKTFVHVVREESRVYPRPMVWRALSNEPFNLSEDEVLEAWKATQETNEYPDIESLEASNGDVYFFSNIYLSRGYAQSLAEYNSVERWLAP